MSYVKTCNPGQIRMDLPTANYIYELPLLSFADIHGPMNLSLIFNQKMKEYEANPFLLTAGYKLNVQKMLEIENGIPVALMEENGNRVSILGNTAPHTFDDESQRILRLVNTSGEPRYEIENPDFSLEYYNSNGMIDSVVDKYGVEVLKFTYNTNGRMATICYRGSKTVQLAYSSDRLAGIIYTQGSCTTRLTYSASYVTVAHYSGETYTLLHSSSGGLTTFLATAVTVDCSTKLQASNQSASISDYVGTDLVNSTVYAFPGNVTGFDEEFDHVDITDYQGVKTRMQYRQGRLLYAYELTGSDVAFTSNVYAGNVQIYRSAENIFASHANGVLAKNDGVPMLYNNISSADEWSYDVNEHTDGMGAAGYYTLTGWTKRLAAGDASIRIMGSTLNTYEPDAAVDGKWKFFAYKFYAASAVIRAFLPADTMLQTKDFRITFQQTGMIDTDDNSNLLMAGTYLESSTATIPFEEAVFCYYNSSSNQYETISDVTMTDVLRYKIKRKRDGSISEAYYDNVYGIVSGVPLLMVLYNGTRYGIGNFDLVTKTYAWNNEYKQKICIDENNPSTDILIYDYVNDNLRSTQKLNKNLDTVHMQADGAITTYTRNSNGLVTAESCKDALQYDNVLYTRATAYGTNTYGNPTITVTDEFDKSTVYTMDPVWGAVLSIVLPDGSSIKDFYDDDGCVKTSRAFIDTTPRGISYTYTDGNLTGLMSGGLSYGFSYSKGDLTAVTKNNTQIEQHEHTKTSAGTTTNSYYPSSASPLHSTLATYDKYGRLQSINGVLTNVYDVDPAFNATTGALINPHDNGSARLAITTDVNCAETARFTYHKNGLLANKTVTDDADKISEETFTYDAINRLTEHITIYDAVLSKSVSDVVTYSKEADAPNADNAVKNHLYKINSAHKALTTNTFDSFNRLDTKKVEMGSSAFIKTFTYTKTRPTSVAENRLGVNYGTNTYSYDDVGRIKSINYTSAKSSGSYRTYEYDKFGQLVRENNQGLAKTFLYSYNGNGNLTSVQEYPYTLSTTPTGTPVTTSFGYTADKLTSFGGATIGYNAMGCPTSYEGKTATWTKGKLSRLYSGTLASGTTNFSYSYNAFGQRVSKTYSYLEGTSGSNPIYSGQVTSYFKKYFYDHSGRLIAETTTKSLYGQGSAGETIVFLYDESGVVGMEYTTGGVANRYYFQRNLQGDVEAIYDISGNLVAKYLYDAWGNCTIASETTDSVVANANPIRYRGYYYDDDTGLYYCNARYYSPKWRRFISPDDTAYLDPDSVNGLNLYCYCNNDPVNYCDPSGYSAILITLGIMAIGGLIGATVSATSSALVQLAINGEINWRSVGIAAVSGFVSGAIAASPLGLPGQMIAGGIIGGASYVADCYVNDTAVTLDGAILSIGMGVLSGWIGGSGANEKNVLTNSILHLKKSAAREARRANQVYAQKVMASMTSYVYNILATTTWGSSIRFAAGCGIANAITTSYSNNSLFLGLPSWSF